MRRVKDPAVITHLEAENAYCASVMAPTQDLQDDLYAEMLGRIQETDLSVPVAYEGWMYYSRTTAGQAYAIHARRKITPEGWESSPEEVLLDENVEAAGRAYYELGDFSLSPGGRYLAWAEDTRGGRQYRLRVRDLRNGRMLRLGRGNPHNRITSMVWAEDDDQSLFYTVEDTQTQRSNELWHHVIGRAEDRLILTENDERFSLSLIKTRSRGFLVLTSGSHTTNELRLLHSLRSAHLVELLDAGAVDGRMYLATRHYPAGSLDVAGPQLPRSQRVAVVADAARGAHDMHEVGVAHRDINPSNIFIDRTRGRLADLGLAQTLAGASATIGTGPIGSLQFIDPDLVWGGKASRSTDVWSLGITLHCVLSDVPPFGDIPEDSLLAAFRHVVHNRPTLDHSFEPELLGVVDRCLAPVDKRFETARDLAECEFCGLPA